MPIETGLLHKMQQLIFFAKEKVRTNKAQERTNKKAFAI